MSRLSESQRLRAEQNRLKALQIRQQKLAALGGSGTLPSTSEPPKSTPGVLQSAAQTPKSTAGYLNFIPPPPKSTPGTPVSTSAVPQESVGVPQFYTPSSFTSSGANHLTSGSIKTTPRNFPSGFGTPQPAVRPEGVNLSEPPAKNPRIEATSKATSSLHPDVVKRIEENKRKAQERQEARRRAREQGISALPVPAAPKVTPPPRPYLQSTSQPVHPNTSDTKNATKPAAPRPSKVVTVTFVLTSAKMFRANTSMYHSATIQVFKTMTSKNYEAQSVGNWIPALLVGLNTFSSHLLFGLSLPLVVVAPLALSVVFPSLRGNCFDGDEASRGEFLLVEDPDVMRESLMSTALSYTFLQAAKVFCTSLAAFVLRRHLMLWKIFAPHFIFEAVGFLVTLLSVLAGLGFTLRVQGALSSWSERLLKTT